MEFQEIDLQDYYRPSPARNPFLEVRWWAFLRGDAYVNPFHDLLYALSRRSQPSLSGGGRKLRSVTFLADRLRIGSPRGQTEEITYADAFDVSLFYHGLYDGMESGQPHRMGYYLTLKVKMAQRDVRIHVKASQGNYLRLLDFLYEQRVQFREFMDGSRSFRANSHIPYRQVQEIKKKYGVRW